MHPKDKIPLHLEQNTVYKWFCPEENFFLSYVENSAVFVEKSKRTQ